MAGLFKDRFNYESLYKLAKENWDVSMSALARYTQYASAEFAVRSFIINDEEHMMEQMAAWAKHNNEHIWRLASEGCPGDKRCLISKNLNDISKTHPDLVVEIARDWYGKDEKTDWIVKHGCRTLLKNGNRDVLGIFGFADSNCVKVDGFSLEASSVSVGEGITFSFEIEEEKGKKFYTKTHSFADTSTRKHYPGIHSVTLIINGAEQGTLDFEVLTAE